MNRIQAIVTEFFQKIQPNEIFVAKNFGLPIFEGPARISDDQDLLSSQLLTAVAFSNYDQLSVQLVKMSLLPPESWPQHFEAITKAQWELTDGTELGFLVNQDSYAFRLLHAVATVIYPTLTAGECLQKVVCGSDWGLEPWDLSVESDDLGWLTTSLAYQLGFPEDSTFHDNLVETSVVATTERNGINQAISMYEQDHEHLFNYIPLSMFQTVIDNMRSQPSVGAGRIITMIIDYIDSNEIPLLIEKVFHGQNAESILSLLHFVELKNLIQILNHFDALTSSNPFCKLKNFGRLLAIYPDQIPSLCQHSSRTLAVMDYSLLDFLKVARTCPAEVVKWMVNTYADRITSMVSNSFIYQDEYSLVTVQDLLKDKNDGFFNALKTYLPEDKWSKIDICYASAQLRFGKLARRIQLTEPSQRVKLAIDLSQLPEWRWVIATEFEKFITQIMVNMSLEQRQELCWFFSTTEKKLIEEAIIRTKDISAMCNNLNSLGLNLVTSMLLNLVKENFLDIKNFSRYSSKFSEVDLLSLINTKIHELLPLMIYNQEWLSMSLASLPAPIALMVWEKVKAHPSIYQMLTFKDIARLGDILLAGQFKMLVECLQPSIATGIANGSMHEMACFSYHVLPHSAAIVNWLWSQFDPITSTLQGFTNFVVMTTFLSRFADSDQQQQSKEAFIMNFDGTYQSLNFSLIFDRFNKAEKFDLEIMLRSRLRQLVTTRDSYIRIAPRLYSKDSFELLISIMPQIMESQLLPGDFVKLTPYFSPDKIEQVWMHLPPKMLTIINFSDLAQLTRGLSEERLLGLCLAIQERAVDLVRSVSEFCSTLKGLPEGKQAILLEWAQPALLLRLKDHYEKNLLLTALSPALESLWRQRLPIASQVTQTNTLFATQQQPEHRQESPMDTLTH